MKSTRQDKNAGEKGLTPATGATAGDSGTGSGASGSGSSGSWSIRLARNRRIGLRIFGPQFRIGREQRWLARHLIRKYAGGAARGKCAGRGGPVGVDRADDKDPAEKAAA
ncbi:hypothetical protein ACQ86N_05320 [Puia sp. P3]|uniref:hypothetical protein n=1 Tax=Puia sp. P3 TaxID=3423952 RepID=UPI003D67E10F